MIFDFENGFFALDGRKSCEDILNYFIQLGRVETKKYGNSKALFVEVLVELLL